MGSKLISFGIIRFPGAVLIGRVIPVREPMAEDDTRMQDLWAQMARDGSLEALRRLPGRFSPDDTTAGWMGDFDPPSGAFNYLAGVLCRPGTCAPEGYCARAILPGLLAVGRLLETEGDEGSELHAAASGQVSRARDAAGYAYDPSRGLWEMETYPSDAFYGALARGERVSIDFYTPCTKASA